MRNGSFQAAAAELRITPHEVRQQIHSLEILLGVPLFTESGRQKEPTEAAVTLSSHIKRGLDAFTTGINGILSTEPSAILALNVSPYFASQFLNAKLEEFRQSNPDIVIQLTTQVSSIGHSDTDTDTAVEIQYGYEDWQQSRWADFHTRRLMVDRKIVCCSANLMKGDYPIEQPAALCGYPLLQTTGPSRLWQSVLSHLGVDHPDPQGGISFPDSASLLEATAQGLGIGLISRVNAMEGIASGRLIAPLGEAVLADIATDMVPGFYLVYSGDNLKLDQVRLFCEWLGEQRWEEIEP